MVPGNVNMRRCAKLVNSLSQLFELLFAQGIFQSLPGLVDAVILLLMVKQ